MIKELATYLCHGYFLDNFRTPMVPTADPKDQLLSVLNHYFLVNYTLRILSQTRINAGKSQISKPIQWILPAFFAGAHFASLNLSSPLAVKVRKVPGYCLATICASSLALSYFAKRSSPLLVGFFAAFALAQRNLQILDRTQEKTYRTTMKVCTLIAAIYTCNRATILSIVDPLIVKESNLFTHYS